MEYKVKLKDDEEIPNSKLKSIKKYFDRFMTDFYAEIFESSEIKNTKYVKRNNNR